MSRKPSKMQSMFKHGPTNIPAADTRLETYTVEITFHSACNLPVADIHTLAGDPYLHAFIHVRDYANPPDEPPLAWRIPTASRTRNPEWNCKWVVAGIPNSGFLLKIKAVDEDCGGRDDRLGKAYLQLSSEHVKEGYELKQKNLRISKRKGSVVPYIMTYVVGVLPGQRIVLHPEVIVSVKVLHKDKKKLEYMKAYTIGPNKYSRHFSPLIGRWLKDKDEKEEEKKDHKEEQHVERQKKRARSSKPPIEVSSFVANKLQLTGPHPPELRHHFVARHAFMDWLFERTGILGRLLNVGLRKQYRTVYSYDHNTEYGLVCDNNPDSDNDTSEKFSQAMASKFVELADYGDGGKIFTYVITVDSEWRFCETGEELTIDFLTKHLMHADLSKVVAFSGEFFVRKRDGTSSASFKGAKASSVDPSLYELVIDNASGTYRPPKDHIEAFQKWLSSPENLGGLGDVIVKDFGDEELKQWKEERKESKPTKGRQRMMRQKSDSSVSSSELGGGESVSSDEVAAAIQENFKSDKTGSDGGEAKASGSNTNKTNPG